MERVVVACAESKATVRSGFFIGERLPLYAGAGGKVLLAFESETQRAEILTSLTLTRLTDQTIGDTDQLARELIGIRRHGYATSANEVSLQSASLAAPVFSGDGRIAAALVVTGPVFRMTRKVLSTLVEPTVEAARTISDRLGSSR